MIGLKVLSHKLATDAHTHLDHKQVKFIQVIVCGCCYGHVKKKERGSLIKIKWNKCKVILSPFADA